MPDERELRKRVLSLETLLDLSQSLNLFVDVEGLANFMLLTVMGQFSLARSAVLLDAGDAGGELLAVAARGVERERLASIPTTWNAGLGKRLRTASGMIAIREAAFDGNVEVGALAEMGFRFAVPLAVKGRPLGAILLGERVHSEPLSPLDEQMLASMARISAIALDNLFLYESLRRSNEDLKEKNVRLEEMDRMKSEFLANAGHELKTPLTCIISYAEFLRDYKTGEPKRREFAAGILSQGEKLHRLIEELLDLASLSSTSLELHANDVDPGALLEREAEGFRYEVDEKGLAIAVSVAPDVGIARIDEDKTRKIARSLIGNAVKFTPPGGTVAVACERAGNELLIRVRDTGIGIAPEHLELIFERFRQVDGSMTRAYGGLGIGLSLAKELAELQGGRITVKSELQKGSEFTLHLPFLAAEGRGGGAAAAQSVERTEEAPKAGPTPSSLLPEQLMKTRPS